MLDNNDAIALTRSFAPLPPTKKVFYLDTNVWGTVLGKSATYDAFVEFFGTGGHLAALSYFGMFELSRARNRVERFDSLLFTLRESVYIPSLYDQLIEAEIENYPNVWNMRWLCLSRLIDDEQPRILGKLGTDPGFIKSREAHRQFGFERFMTLEELKINFPPESGDHYSPDDAEYFTWCNTVDYLGRHFPEFLLRFKDDASKLTIDSLLSSRIRSHYLFFKYYVHGQSPRESDFFDLNHVTYAPYCDVYVTERNCLNVLRRIKALGLMLSETRVVHVMDFLAELRST